MSERPPPHCTLVVDDLPDSRDWLAQAVRRAHPRTRLLAAGSLAEARQRLREASPELALVDLDLPDGSGIGLIETLVRLPQRPTVIVATVFADDQHLFPALRAGAQGYVLKDASIDQLAAWLSGLSRGETALSPPIARRLLGWFFDPDAVHAPPLSPREQELLVLLAKGLTIGQAAAVLAVTPATAASYAKTLYRKLDVTNRAEATLEATRRGLIQP